VFANGARRSKGFAIIPVVSPVGCIGALAATGASPLAWAGKAVRDQRMARLEDLTRGANVTGILPSGQVTVVDVRWHGSAVIELTYKDGGGTRGNELLYRDDEPRLIVVEAGRPWSFDGDGELLRLVSEAHRIDLAHLFDSLLAVHISIVNPLPHQIMAVSEAMLPRQPLRVLYRHVCLADTRWQSPLDIFHSLL
jgi:hypothetical protein